MGSSASKAGRHLATTPAPANDASPAGNGCSPAYPADTVILKGVFGRGPNAPSMSPFVLKLETFLRMAGIQHQTEAASEPSPVKRKAPWIVYNGQVVEDTELCIKYLNEKLGIDLDQHLSKQEKAIAHSFRVMLDEFMFWTSARVRFTPAAEVLAAYTGLPLQVLQGVREQAYVPGCFHQGVGRHTDEELVWFAEGIATSLADYLGDKPYLMGDQPCHVDCSMFGHLAQQQFQMPGSPQEAMLRDRFPTLTAYIERMRDAYWPDWSECHTHHNTRPALK